MTQTTLAKTNLPLVTFAFMAGMGAAAQFAKFSVFFVELNVAYPNSGVALGILVSLISLMGALLSVVIGGVVKQLGARGPLVFALILAAIISLLQARFPSLSLMLGLRALEGISHLLIVIIAPALISEYSIDRHRNFTLSVWSTFFGATFALTAYWGTGFVASFGLDGFVNLHAAYMLALAILLWSITPKPTKQPWKGLNFRASLAAHKVIYRSPYLSAPATGWLFYTMTYVAMLTLVPPFIPAAERALVVTIMPLTGMIMAMTLGTFLLRYLSGTSLVILGFSLAAIAVLGTAIAPSISLPVIMVFAALGLVQSGTFASVAQLSTSFDNRALSFAGISQLGNLGNVIGTPLLYLISLQYGHTAMFVTIAGFYLIAALLHAILGKRRTIMKITEKH